MAEAAPQPLPPGEMEEVAGQIFGDLGAPIDRVVATGRASRRFATQELTPCFGEEEPGQAVNQCPCRDRKRKRLQPVEHEIPVETLAYLHANEDEGEADREPADREPEPPSPSRHRPTYPARQSAMVQGSGWRRSTTSSCSWSKARKALVDQCWR